MRNKNCRLAMKFALGLLGGVENGVNYQSHLKEVLKYGRFLQKIYGGDLEIVELSCILHDVGMKDGVKTHSFLGRKMARKFLETTPVSPDKMRRILYCIAYHNRKPLVEDNLELKIVRDADGIANFKNPTTIALLFYRAYHDEREEFVAGIERALDRCDTTYGRLVFLESKKIAKSAYTLLIKFFRETLDYFKGRRDGKKRK